MILDIYTHLFPPKYLEALSRQGAGLGSLAARMKAVPAVSDLDARFREMDAVAGDYRQVIAPPHPVLEEIAAPADAARLAMLANDEMAAIRDAHPDRFAAFVATVALTDMDAALAEADRAIDELGAKGVQIYTNVAGRPLDDPGFRPIFAKAAEHDLPVWIHPARTAAHADYAAEARSRFEMWWCFGWPYETSVALSRLIFDGLFDRHPGLKIVTHHLGGMIPFFDGRIGPGMDYLGSRTADEDYSGILPGLKRPHLDYFRMLHADTAMFGGTSGLPAGLRFYGAGHVVFATDHPFGPIGPTLAALDTIDLAPVEREAILHGNAAALLRLDG